MQHILFKLSLILYCMHNVFASEQDMPNSDFVGEPFMVRDALIAETNIHKKHLDPYTLEELYTDYFEKKDFKKCAQTLILAALYNNTETLDFLVKIDSDILKYLDSDLQESKQFKEFYKNTLFPKVLHHIQNEALQFAALEIAP